MELDDHLDADAREYAAEERGPAGPAPARPSPPRAKSTFFAVIGDGLTLVLAGDPLPDRMADLVPARWDKVGGCWMPDRTGRGQKAAAKRR